MFDSNLLVGGGGGGLLYVFEDLSNGRVRRQNSNYAPEDAEAYAAVYCKVAPPPPLIHSDGRACSGALC